MAECKICTLLMIPENRVFLPCFHSYHDICIDNWMKKKHTCPECRTDITPLALNRNISLEGVIEEPPFIPPENDGHPYDDHPDRYPDQSNQPNQPNQPSGAAQINVESDDEADYIAAAAAIAALEADYRSEEYSKFEKEQMARLLGMPVELLEKVQEAPEVPEVPEAPEVEAVQEDKSDDDSSSSSSSDSEDEKEIALHKELDALSKETKAKVVAIHDKYDIKRRIRVTITSSKITQRKSKKVKEPKAKKVKEPKVKEVKAKKTVVKKAKPIKKSTEVDA